MLENNPKMASLPTGQATWVLNLNPCCFVCRKEPKQWYFYPGVVQVCPTLTTNVRLRRMLQLKGPVCKI